MDKGFLQTVAQQTQAAVEQLLDTARIAPGGLVVIGCSTSEVQGERIGSAGSVEIAGAIFSVLKTTCEKEQLHLAIQCCEHLNRALVVEKSVQKEHGFREVTVIPALHAGGAMAMEAMKHLQQPVVVETIVADAGLDIGSTLIGMHIRRVAVPVRLQQKQIGKAAVIAARSRPPLIGGARAVYP